MRLHRNLALGRGTRSGGGGPVSATRLLANDAQVFWYQADNALHAGGATYVISMTGTTSNGKIELHEIVNEAGSWNVYTHLISHLGNLDDHNAGGIVVLPDNRIMVMYGIHTDTRGTRYRISKGTAGNIRGFGREFNVPVNGSTTSSYYHAYAMPNGYFYLIRRSNTDTPGAQREQQICWIQTSQLEALPNPTTWNYLKFAMRPSQRPYGKYCKWGADQIFGAISYGHPGEVSTGCGMYALRIDCSAVDGTPTFWRMDGTQITAPTPFDVAANCTLVDDATGTDQNEKWPYDCDIGANGYPQFSYTNHNTPTTGLGPSGLSINSEYWVARWNGTSFDKIKVGTGRSPLASQRDYTGGCVFDNADKNKVWMGYGVGDVPSEVVPATIDWAGPSVALGTPVTASSAKDNIRLWAPRGATGSPVKVGWSSINAYPTLNDFEMDMQMYGTAARPSQASSLDPTTAAFIARMNITPSAAWQAAYDTFIRLLKNGKVNGTNYLALSGVLYIMAAHDKQAAMLDLKGSGSTNAADVGTGCIFTANRGFTGRGTSEVTDYMQLPAPSAIPGFAQNSAHVGMLWTPASGGLRRIASGSPILMDSGSNRLNETPGVTRSPANNTEVKGTDEFTLMNRTASNACAVVVNGDSLISGTGASTAVDTAALVWGYSTTSRASLFMAGPALTAAQIEDLNYAVGVFDRLVNRYQRIV